MNRRLPKHAFNEDSVLTPMVSRSEAPPVPTFVPSRLPMPLMLVIFSIALRLEFEMVPEPLQGTMSSTGDEYLSAAKYMMSRSNNCRVCSPLMAPQQPIHMHPRDRLLVSPTY
jgi:hypothetical protein